MDLGTFRHETVFDTIEGSGNISMPIAARPRRSAVAATSWRRKRWASPSSRISLTATFMAAVRCVGMDTGWRRGAPSGTLPPRDTGTHHSFQRRRSYAKLRAGLLRRSMTSHARGLTATRAIPSGAARHFCAPVMLRVMGSRTLWSKRRWYAIDGGWFIAWMTGNGSSVGPGIMRTGRVWHWAQLIVRGTTASFVAGSAGPVPFVGGLM